jgi:hypothetical protein
VTTTTTEAKPREPQLAAAVDLSFDLIASMRNAVDAVESCNEEMGKQLVRERQLAMLEQLTR